MDMEIVFPGGKKVDAIYKNFIIRTDQSKRSGGEDTAPQPFDLFLASIGTCSGVYVLYFCQERNISTKGLRLFLQTEKDRETKMIKKITIEIQPPPEFPEKYKKAVIKAAHMCAVTKHLYNPPIFDVYAKTPEI